jgi:hypothetical protein
MRLADSDSLATNLYFLFGTIVSQPFTGFTIYLLSNGKARDSRTLAMQYVSAMACVSADMSSRVSMTLV